MSGTTANLCAKGTSTTLVRPKFEPGMLLQHDDLDQLSLFTQELNRLLFRSFFGCGVICGLSIDIGKHCGQQCVKVAPGVGLTCVGDPVYVPTEQCIVIDVNCAPNPNAELWVVLCSKTKCCAPRTSMCPDDEDETASVCTRERYGFEICVVAKKPDCACGCKPKPKAAGESVDTSSSDDSDTEMVLDESSIAPEPDTTDDPCACVSPLDPCYKNHYDGKCTCECGECVGDCNCILLARLDRKQDGDNVTWTIDHTVRRFIRPVLMRDPLLPRKQAKKKEGEQAEYKKLKKTTAKR